ncbi:AHH domain-containing protein [Dyella sp.]|uniref:AHH domain-containing protein n=1 Tax=Dyella sp. TaxID=1869338 RepID=UPI002D77F1B8|nr:AHH domain-containing protein [Dyella sp.]HET7329895.1 AHH domain-containing protein [Dyella sp.]
MAFDRASGAEADPLLQADSNLLDLRVTAGQSMRQANPVEAVNALKLEEQKDKVRYKNGQTLVPRARKLFAATLRTDAERKARHSIQLSNNMIAAGQTRPDGVAAHHIVARRDPSAESSRRIIFAKGIAINDVDNGVFLPRWKSSQVQSLPNATKHSVVHTEIYHLAVYSRLLNVPGNDRKVTRTALKTIKQELVDGVFPYMPEEPQL